MRLAFVLGKIFNTQNSFYKIRSFSTHSYNNNIIVQQLNDVLTLRQTPISNWIVEVKYEITWNFIDFQKRPSQNFNWTMLGQGPHTRAIDVENVRQRGKLIEKN